MTSPQYQFADNHSLSVNSPNAGVNQPGKRASLLAGLRTGGPRSNSPAPNFAKTDFADQAAAQLKATAAVFTPRSNSLNSPPNQLHHELPAVGSQGARGAVVDERLALMQQHHAQHQQIQQAQLAALYSNNNQGHAQVQDYNQQEQLLLHQQKHAQQMLQNQLAAQQQMQLDMLRLQALQQQHAQQQQQQQVQAQQRALLARIQAEYERQAQIAALVKRQEEVQEQLRLQQRHQEELAQQAAFAQLQHGSAREQRQAAQASIQASLRNRRDEQQLHAQQIFMEQLQRYNDANGVTQFEEARHTSPPPSLAQQQTSLELENLMRSITLAQQEDNRHRSQSPPSAMDHQGARTPSFAASAQSQQTPTQAQPNGGQSEKRNRLSSHADTSASWRSSLGAMAGAAALRKNSNTPPSIVIDDSDSDYSVSRSSMDGVANLRRSVGGRSALANVNNSEPDTPETSEEDLSGLQSMVASATEKMGNVSAVTSDVPAVLPSGQLNSKATNVIRSSALAGLLGNMASAQRNRADSMTGHASLPARPVLALNGAHTASGRTPSPPTDSLLLAGGVHAGAANNGVSAPRRQPKGPPTEFLAHNFASRLNTRTRRDAMSKLCASPRAGVLSFVNSGATLTRATAA
ncbi:hypothetical protein OC846_003299 [Tilletia horrida]|uniref:Uncharacterized protein n=1 Tax=Tilletia horrida TaxID=155126 RepID=A0AAN6GPR1_9BASI|nr:hypothetical protein OC845_002550 [Tilletia horrida]KAK0551429.1 hypothetical protein OC846_003299 [Tilletia horrida]KAK0566399.1 hypothetical protein OC861_003265 [Tilletia horrida]